jgi:SM-20-related protein
MTSKQILDAFSETLMQDERILSSRERELLTILLQNAREASGNNPQTQSAVSAVIARSVGETVAQRAFTLLGSSIVEQIVARGATAPVAGDALPATVFGGPQPPSTGPQPPSKGPLQPADKPLGPQPPSGPQPPNIGLRHSVSAERAAQQKQPDSGSIAVLDAPAIVRAQCVVLDEFLAPHEMEELIRYTLEHEAQFTTSEVISPSGEPGMTDYSHRRSRVLMELGPHEETILSRIQKVLPRVLEQMGMEEFPVTQTEVQITASNDGDFFRAHCDDAQEMIASRRLTFVYFFHREPNQFEGGELRLHDSVKSSDHPLNAGSFQTIMPQQNQIVFFPCSTLHEITAVQCRSRAFADSRFTVNGWLHQ